MSESPTCGFFIPGIPKPGGSKRGFIVKTKSGKQRVALVDANKNVGDWKDAVHSAARNHAPPEPWTGAVWLSVRFYLPRPRSHYRTGKHAGTLRNAAPMQHTQKPDRTKLLRPLEDAMKGIFWRDDCQVTDGPVSKLWTVGQPGAHVVVTYLSESETP